MAAVLCRSVGTICSGVTTCTDKACSIVGDTCIKLPCRACGSACCSKFRNGCSNPFSLYVGVAVVCNAPSSLELVRVLLSIVSGGSSFGCDGNKWLLVHALLSCVHIAAAFYMFLVVSNNSNKHTTIVSTNAYKRAVTMLCDDVTMALYILVVLGYIAWLWTGAAWAVTGKLQNGGGNCAYNVTSRVSLCLGLGYAFLTLGCFSLVLSVCRSYFFGYPVDPYDNPELPSSDSYMEMGAKNSAPAWEAASKGTTIKETTTGTGATATTTVTKKAEIPVQQAVMY